MTVFVIIFIILLLVSVILHEVMHGFIADRMGDPTARHQGRLTLNPISHIDPIGSILVPAFLFLAHSPFLFGWAKPVPYNPNNLRDKKYGDAKVAFAGPATNLVIALIFGLVVRFGAGELPLAFIAISAVITLLNIALGIFNLLPVPPLDGSKIFFTFLPYRLRHIEHTMERYWFVSLGVLLIVVYLFLGPVLITLFELLTGAPVAIAFAAFAS